METAFAFEEAGARADLVHINRLSSGEVELSGYQILAIPGGFSYGDDIASGKILANELKYRIEEDIQKFVGDGKLIIGICNGFQILVKSGLLPNLSGDFKTIETTLTLNDSAKFEDRWVYLNKVKSNCAWTSGVKDIIYLPIAHGEGKFIPKDDRVLSDLKKKGLVVFEYADEKGRKKGFPYNPNGSVENIAGICDRTGRILGLMPHPERHLSFLQHPRWTRQKNASRGDGFAIFKSGVDFFK